jgi:hypothetical protein
MLNYLIFFHIKLDNLESQKKWYMFLETIIQTAIKKHPKSCKLRILLAYIYI